MCMTSAHGTTNGSAYAIWWAMLCGTSTQTDRGCTRCPIFMRSLRSQPLSSALRLKNNTREQHECTNLMHSDLEWGGMGNRCELPINVVRTSKAKVLRALNQKVSGVVEELPLLLSQTSDP